MPRIFLLNRYVNGYEQDINVVKDLNMKTFNNDNIWHPLLIKTFHNFVLEYFTCLLQIYGLPFLNIKNRTTHKPSSKSI